MSLDAVFGFADSSLHFCHRRKASEKTSTGLGHKASEVLRSPSRVRDVAHLREGSHSLERHRLDLAHAFACDCEAAANLLERLRLAVAEAVAQGQHLSLPVFQERECPEQRLAPQRDLDLLFEWRAFACDEVGKDNIPLLTNWLVEAGGDPR